MNRTITILAIVLLLINTLFSLNCGSDTVSNEETQPEAGSASGSTGDVSLDLVWNTNLDERSTLARSAPISLDADGRIDCDGSEISTIYVRIYDQSSGTFMIDNGNGWKCNDHYGVLQRVPSGNRKLVCLARDAQNNVIYRGEQPNIIVYPADTSPARIEMQPFTSDPLGMEDDAQTSEDTPEFQCSTVSNTHHYHLQVAADETFEEIMIDETSDTNSFKPSFATSNRYYWRVCPVDMHGSEGAWSQPRTVNVTLPPRASTDPAIQVTKTSAVLQGTVNPRGLPTTCYFEYGTTPDYGSTTDSVDASTGATNTAVSASLQGIAAGTSYHYRLVATNSAGTTLGLDQTFSTGLSVVETSPADNAVDMSTTTTILARFSEPINIATLTASSFVVNDGRSQISGTIICKGTTATFTPTVELNANTVYTVALTTDIESQTGTPLLSKVTWSFTTVETMAPNLKNTYPPEHGRGVQVFPTIRAVFDEPMDAGSINSKTFLVNDGMEYIDGTIAYEDATMTATFIPESNLSCNTTYTITITNDVKDTLGNAMAADKIFQFKTADSCGGKIFVGRSHTMVLKTDGTIWAWGNNFSGQLGNGTSHNARPTPMQIGIDNDWASVTAGGFHTAALKTDGTLWAWGDNEHGQLGDGAADEDKWSPSQIGTDKDWANVSAGNYFSIALKTDGTLWAWGNNEYGQLGDGAANEDKYTPLQIGTDKDWAAVSAGDFDTVVLKTDGTIWALGKNVPYALTNKPWQVGTDNDWTNVDAGEDHVVALKADGTIWARGSNSHGQLGNEKSLHYTLTQIGTGTDWAHVAPGSQFTVGLKTDGTVWAWGSNSDARLGIGNSKDKHIPTVVGTFSDWATVSSSLRHTVAVRTDGTLWAWGYNLNGHLGDGTSKNRLIPTQLGTGNDWTEAEAGGGLTIGSDGINNRPDQCTYTIAIKRNGSLWAWGHNSSGQLGDGTYYPKYAPIQIGTFSDWSILSAGLFHSAALKKDGSLWTWGDSLGNATATPSKIGFDTNWAVVDAGYKDTVALKIDGTLWAWGYNSFGQIYDGTDKEIYMPTKIGTDTDWMMARAGIFHTVAIKTNGTLWAWGVNSDGQLGDGTNDEKLTPTRIGTDTDWDIVDAGTNHSVALKTDGTLWAWGGNLNGQLGDETNEEKYTPTKIGTDTDWIAVIAGDNISYALKSDGTLWAWGDNSDGQLGDGTNVSDNIPSPVLVPFRIF